MKFKITTMAISSLLSFQCFSAPFLYIGPNTATNKKSLNVMSLASNKDKFFSSKNFLTLSGTNSTSGDNLLKGYNSSLKQIIQGSALRRIAFNIYHSDPEGYNNFVSKSSKQIIDNSLGIDSSESAHFGPFHETASVKMSRDSESTDSSLTFTYIGRQHYIMMSEVSPKITNDEEYTSAARDALKAPEFDSELFRRSYGDQYIANQDAGASIVINFKIDFQSTDDKNKADISASGGMKFATLSAEVKKMSDKKNIHGTISIEAFQQGGFPNKLGDIFVDKDDKNDKISVFQCSISDPQDCINTMDTAIKYATGDFKKQTEAENLFKKDDNGYYTNLFWFPEYTPINYHYTVTPDAPLPREVSKIQENLKRFHKDKAKIYRALESLPTMDTEDNYIRIGDWDGLGSYDKKTVNSEEYIKDLKAFLLGYDLSSQANLALFRPCYSEIDIDKCQLVYKKFNDDYAKNLKLTTGKNAGNYSFLKYGSIRLDLIDTVVINENSELSPGEGWDSNYYSLKLTKPDNNGDSRVEIVDSKGTVVDDLSGAIHNASWLQFNYGGNLVVWNKEDGKDKKVVWARNVYWHTKGDPKSDVPTKLLIGKNGVSIMTADGKGEGSQSHHSGYDNTHIYVSSNSKQDEAESEDNVSKGFMQLAPIKSLTNIEDDNRLFNPRIKYQLYFDGAKYLDPDTNEAVTCGQEDQGYKNKLECTDGSSLSFTLDTIKTPFLNINNKNCDTGNCRATLTDKHGKEFSFKVYSRNWRNIPATRYLTRDADQKDIRDRESVFK